jgi:hypothetical protein
LSLGLCEQGFNMHKILKSLASIIIFLSWPSFSQELKKGENLIAEYSSELNSWKFGKQEKGKLKQFMWQNPEKGWADSYIVSITNKHKGSLQGVRIASDAPGYESCDAFESTDIPFPKDIGFPIMYWQTSCSKNNGFKAKMLHLLILGKDSLYHIEKTWQGDVSESEIQKWKSRFETAYVCNTKNKSLPCPMKVE